MRQLGELKENAEKFEAAGVDVIAVFREEQKGVEGLEIIRENTGVTFQLGLDNGNEKTGSYSPGRREFTNYVVDKSGTVRGVISGDLRNRANSNELMAVISEMAAETEPSVGADAAEIEAVQRAVLDYVDGIYDVKPELIERSVHPQLSKFGFMRPEGASEFQPGAVTTFEELRNLAGSYNADGKIPADAPKEVAVFAVMDNIATAKVTAAWGVDMLHLVKQDDSWKILQIVWQSMPEEK